MGHPGKRSISSAARSAREKEAHNCSETSFFLRPERETASRCHLCVSQAAFSLDDSRGYVTLSSSSFFFLWFPLMQSLENRTFHVIWMVPTSAVCTCHVPFLRRGWSQRSIRTDQKRLESRGKKNATAKQCESWGQLPLAVVVTYRLQPFPQRRAVGLSPPTLTLTRHRGGSGDKPTAGHEQGSFRGPWLHICWIHLLPELLTEPLCGSGCRASSEASEKEGSVRPEGWASSAHLPLQLHGHGHVLGVGSDGAPILTQFGALSLAGSHWCPWAMCHTQKSPKTQEKKNIAFGS